MPEIAVEPPFEILGPASGLPELKNLALSLYQSGKAQEPDHTALAHIIRQQLQA